MRSIDMTLLEQMRITEIEIDNRLQLFGIEPGDARLLKEVGEEMVIEHQLDEMVEVFYQQQISIPEIALLIGDADTLTRLHRAQRSYLLDLFSGHYDVEYVNNRLRIGMVHKRIGVEPKLYLAAIQSLRVLIEGIIYQSLPCRERAQKVVCVLSKLIMFDTSLVFDTYIRSLVSEIEVSKQKSERYAGVLEEKVKERTLQLEKLSRTDPLTGLLNIRHLEQVLKGLLRAAERRHEPVTVVYIDIDDFKEVNDTHGHQKGDQCLRFVADALHETVRADDHCFRYGGDEFCVVMSNCDKASALGQWVARFQRKVADKDSTLSLSIGVVDTGPKRFLDSRALIQLADKAMYKVKRERKKARLLSGVDMAAMI